MDHTNTISLFKEINGKLEWEKLVETEQEN